MRSARIGLVIVISLVVVGVAGSPAWAMRPVPVDQRGLSAPVVVQVAPAGGVDARGDALGRRVPPLLGSQSAVVAPAAGVDARGDALGRRVPPLQGGQPPAALPRAGVDARGLVLGRRVPPVVR